MENSIFLDLQYAISPIANPLPVVKPVEGKLLIYSLEIVKEFLRELYDNQSAIDAGLKPILLYTQSDFTNGNKYLLIFRN